MAYNCKDQFIGCMAQDRASRVFLARVWQHPEERVFSGSHCSESIGVEFDRNRHYLRRSIMAFWNGLFPAKRWSDVDVQERFLGRSVEALLEVMAELRLDSRPLSI